MGKFRSLKENNLEIVGRPDSEFFPTVSLDESKMPELSPNDVGEQIMIHIKAKLVEVNADLPKKKFRLELREAKYIGREDKDE